MDEQAFEIQLKSDFLNEAAEILEKLEIELLKLEKSLDHKKSLNELFRQAHTLKGSGMVAGFTQLGAFAHKVENLLDKLRNQDLPPLKADVDVLLLSSDKLKEFISNLMEDFNAQVPSSHLEEILLSRITNESPSLAVEPPPPVQESTAKNAIKTLKLVIPKTNISAAKYDFIQQFIPTIFVAAEDPATREMIKELLPKTWNIEMFSDGDSVLATIETKEPTLVISTTSCSGLGEDVFLKKLRSKKMLSEIIFISSSATAETLDKFFSLGAFAIFSKPIKNHDFVHIAELAVDSYLKKMTLKKISQLAFRAYQKLMSIDEIVELKHLDPTKIKKMQELEEDMTKIGAFCTFAQNFGTHSK